MKDQLFPKRFTAGVFYRRKFEYEGIRRYTMPTGDDAKDIKYLFKFLLGTLMATLEPLRSRIFLVKVLENIKQV